MAGKEKQFFIAIKREDSFLPGREDNARGLSRCDLLPQLESSLRIRQHEVMRHEQRGITKRYYHRLAGFHDKMVRCVGITIEAYLDTLYPARIRMDHEGLRMARGRPR